jgi:hypothetical protein
MGSGCVSCDVIYWALNFGPLHAQMLNDGKEL